MQHTDDGSARAGSRIARNAVTLTVCRVGADALGLLLFVAISRAWGPSGTGAYSYGFAVATLIFFLTSLGLDTFGVREYLRLPAAKRQRFLGELLGTQLLIVAAAALGLVIYLALTTPQPATLSIVATLTCFQIANSLAQTLFVPAMAQQRIGQSALFIFAARAAAFLPAAICIQFTSLSLTQALVSFPIAAVILLALAVGRAIQDHVSLRPIFSKHASRRLGLALWSFASAELVAQAFPRVGLITLGIVVGDAAAGLYATGMKLLELTCVPVTLLGVAAFPRLSQLYDHDQQAFRTLAIRLLWVLVLTSGGVGWIMYFIAPNLLVPLLGSGFAGTEPVMQKMALIGIPQTAETILWPLLLASGQQIARFKMASVALLCNLLLNMVLVPFVGIDGAIWASGFSFLLMTALFVAVLQPVLGRHSPLVPIFAAFAIAPTAAVLIAEAAHGAGLPEWIQAIVTALVFFSIVGLCYWISRNSQLEDRTPPPAPVRDVAHLPSLSQQPMRYALLLDDHPWAHWQLDTLRELVSVTGSLPRLCLINSAGDSLRSDVATQYLPAALRSVSICLLQARDSATIERRLSDEQLDFVLCLGDFQTGRSFAATPKFGVWAYHVGDWVNYRGSAPGFWEVYCGEIVSTAMLVRLSSDEHEVFPLKVATLRTKRHSTGINLRQLQARFPRWPVQVIRELQAGSWSVDTKPLRSAVRLRSSPTAVQRTICSLRMLQWAFIEFFRSTFVSEQWNVGIVEQPIERFLTSEKLPAVRWLPKMRRREFIADPFGVVRNGKLTIFCEHFDYATGLGQLIALDPGQPHRKQIMSIGPEPPVHLSYPYLLEVDGELLCVPESVKAREVALYASERFPDRWRRVCTLIADAELVDVTLFQHNGRWWLAGSDAGAAGASCELHLWYADQITGPWRPHLSNPVKIDVRSSRPAGTPFWSEGILYRPTQDCSTCYGWRVIINRIVTLSPTEFAEEPARTVEPTAMGLYRAGLHTLSAVGNVTLIDSKRRVFAKEELPRAVGRLWSMLVGKHGTKAVANGMSFDEQKSEAMRMVD